MKLRLEEVLKEKGISKYKLLQLTGLNPGVLWKLIHNKSSPTLRTLEKIARALNMSIADLIEIEEEEKKERQEE